MHVGYIHRSVTLLEGYEDTKGVIIICYRRRTDNTMAKKKVQKDIQQSTKRPHKSKDRLR